MDPVSRAQNSEEMIWLLGNNREIGWMTVSPKVWQAVLKQIEDRMEQKGT